MRAVPAAIAVLAFVAGFGLPFVAFGVENEQVATTGTTAATATTSGAITGTNATATTGTTTGTTGATTTGITTTGTTTGTSGTTTGTTGTTTTGTTTGGQGAPAGRKYLGLRQWLAGVVALGLLFSLLAWMDRTLRRRMLAREQRAFADGQKRKLIEYPVLRFMFIGEDGRWSTSRTLASAWTLTLVWAIAALAIAKLFGAPMGWNAFSAQATSWQYLLLLGGPVGAAIGAKAVTTLKEQAGEVKTDPPDGAAFSQLYTDDRGRLDLIDAQYLAFNALSIAVFLIVFISEASAGLPKFPAILAALTAATAAAYLAKKAALRAAPALTSIAPPAAAPGETVRIWGINLTPPREPDTAETNREIPAELHPLLPDDISSVEVYFDGIASRSIRRVTPQTTDLHESYDVVVPAGVKIADSVSVVVNGRGRRGLKSAAFTDFKTLGPSLTTITPPLAEPGGAVIIRGTRLAVGGKPHVLFGSQQADGDAVSHNFGGDASLDVLEVRVPELAIGNVKVRVITLGGQASNELSLDIGAAVRIGGGLTTIALGPDNPRLVVSGVGFRTDPARRPTLAGVFLDGHPLAVDEASWQPSRVVADLPTDPIELKRLGFTSKNDAELVVRNDRGVTSPAVKVVLSVAAPPGDEDEPPKAKEDDDDQPREKDEQQRTKKDHDDQPGEEDEPQGTKDNSDDDQPRERETKPGRNSPENG